MDTLVHDGFIEQRKKHEKIQIVDSKTGIPTTRVIPYYEYRVTIVDEIKSVSYTHLDVYKRQIYGSLGK